MNSFKQVGEVLTLTAPAGGVVSGTPVLIGGILVVPASTVAETLPFEGRVLGVFSGTKTAAQAWTEGQKVYWNIGTNKFDSDPTTGPLVGVATAIAANPSTSGSVRLNGTAAALLEGGAEAAIADLVITVPACAGGATPTAAQVDTAITNTAAPIIAKLNAVLATLRLSGLIAP